MKYMKNIFFAASLAFASLSLISFGASAALITHSIIGQDTLDDEYYILGSISIDTAKADIFDEVDEFVQFEILGVDQTIDPLGLFFAGFDSSNIFAGIEYFGFDTLWDGVGFAFSGYYDAFGPSVDNTIDVFFPSGNLFGVFVDVFLTDAEVVSEPPMLALILALGSVLFVRRKNTKL